MAGLEPIATLEPMDAKSTWSQRAVAGSKWGKDGRQWDDSRRCGERVERREEEAGGPLWHEEREPVGQLLLARAAAGGTTPRANSHEMIESERVRRHHGDEAHQTDFSPALELTSSGSSCFSHPPSTGRHRRQAPDDSDT